MKTTFAGHIIKTQTDMSIEPGHQLILVSPADPEAKAILFTLTGVAPYEKDCQITLDGAGNSWISAPHHDLADARLVALLDICADLRFTAPHMMQLRLVTDGT
jgi:hypothetical protein